MNQDDKVVFEVTASDTKPRADAKEWAGPCVRDGSIDRADVGDAVRPTNGVGRQRQRSPQPRVWRESVRDHLRR